MRKGSSLFVWFVISGLIPVLGPLAAALYRRETEEALRICPGCHAAVRHYDAMCMRCGTDLEYPDEAELIEPDPSIRVRARL
jgi:predicted amidophosphoribosyltransferase